MRLSNFALVTVVAFGSLFASEVAIGQDVPASVALDALGTARQLASEGRLQDALHIAYLVQNQPDLTEDESEGCRRLLAQCQSLAISFYVERSASSVRSPERPSEQYSSAGETGGEQRFGREDGEPVPTFGQADSATATRGSTAPSGLRDEADHAASQGEFSSRVPRLLSEHSQDASLLFPPPNRPRSTASEQMHGIETEVPPIRIRRVAADQAVPVPSQPDSDSIEGFDQSGEAAKREASVNSGLQSSAGSTIEPVQLWPCVVPSAQCAGAWMLVAIGVLAGTGGRWLVQIGHFAVKVARQHYQRPASIPVHYSGQRSFTSGSHAKNDIRFSDICSRIADDNRRLR